MTAQAMTKSQIVAALEEKGITVKNVSNIKVAELAQMLADANKVKTGRKPRPAIDQKDGRYNMYFVALPKAIRDAVLKQDLCPRRLYNEYRKRGRDHMLATYTAAQA